MKLSEHELLTHAGKVSAEQAIEKAEEEFKKYKKDRDKDYISDFDRATKAIEQKAAKRIPKKKRRENG